MCFIGIVAWYKLAESCAENLHKGSAVLVEGELQSRQWRTDDGHYRNVVEIKARRIQFLNKREMVLSDMESNQGYPEGEELEGSEGGSDTNNSEDQNGDSVSPDADNDRDEGGESSFDFGFRDLKL